MVSDKEGTNKQQRKIGATITHLCQFGLLLGKQHSQLKMLGQIIDLFSSQLDFPCKLLQQIEEGFTALADIGVLIVVLFCGINISLQKLVQAWTGGCKTSLESTHNHADVLNDPLCDGIQRSYCQKENWCEKQWEQQDRIQ